MKDKGLILIVGVCCFIAYFLLVKHAMLFMLSDAYYYSSLAESLNQTDHLYSLTTIPRQPIVTTQNGIVLLQYVCIQLGVDNAAERLYYLSVLCFLVSLFSLFTIKKLLTDIFYYGKVKTFLVLLAIALNTKWHTSLLQPINDVFFVFLAVFYIYIFLIDRIVFSKKVIYFIFISLLITHFRMQALLVFFTAAIVCFYFKNYKEGITHITLSVVSILSVWVLNYFIVDDYSGIGSITEYFFNNLTIDYLIDSFNTLTNSTLPILFFGTKKLSQYYSTLFAFMIFILFVAGYKSTVNHDKRMIFIFIFILLNVLLVVIFPSQTARYLLVVLPFIIILLLDFIPSIPFQKWFLGAYVTILFFLLSYRVFFSTPDTSLDEGVGLHFDIDYSLNKENSNKFKHKYSFEYDLVTETYKGRVTYFLFDKSSVDDQKTSNDRIIYAGTPVFFEYFKKKLLKEQVTILSEKESNLKFNLSHHLRNDAKIFELKVRY
ncbi:MAG: hypothetical protein COB35_06930 [Gammaproteobacteria bacterium]|nr:MAG: hypothetical protein COB35_06930 [Gammaproteobacteria bacterium]